MSSQTAAMGPLNLPCSQAPWQEPGSALSAKASFKWPGVCTQEAIEKAAGEPASSWQRAAWALTATGTCEAINCSLCQLRLVDECELHSAHMLLQVVETQCHAQGDDMGRRVAALCSIWARSHARSTQAACKAATRWLCSD